MMKLLREGKMSNKEYELFLKLLTDYIEGEYWFNIWIGRKNQRYIGIRKCIYYDYDEEDGLNFHFDWVQVGNKKVPPTYEEFYKMMNEFHTEIQKKKVSICHVDDCKTSVCGDKRFCEKCILHYWFRPNNKKVNLKFNIR